MKLERLLEMTTLLINRKKTSAKDLAEHFGVSTRTIYRDIDVLSIAGIPVYTTKGRGGGICLMEEYTLNRSMITDDEKNQIMFGLQSLQATQYPEIDKIIEKVSSVFQTAREQPWVAVDFSGWQGPEEKDKFLHIKEAILSCHTVSFNYHNSYGEQAHRVAEPLQLLFKGKSWYVYAFCQKHHDIRLFKLSRIRSLEILDTLFTPKRVPQEVINYSKDDQKHYTFIHLILRFSPHVGYRLYDEFPLECITACKDGSYMVDISYPEGEWVYTYLLSFGPYVKVLEPKHAQDALLQLAKKITENYI